MSKLQKELARIQSELKAPKGQYNSFGGYKYRSCEDILEAVKKIKGDCIVTLSDDIVNVGDRYYIKATATIALEGETIAVSAFARESLTKKGMDDSQITGTASSYARKYACNGLFLIDDTKDADTDQYANAQKERQNKAPAKQQKPASKSVSTPAETQESEDYMSKMHDKAWDMFDKLKNDMNEKQRQYLTDILNKRDYKECVRLMNKFTSEQKAGETNA